MALKFYKVFPNPYTFLDADGVPQGVLIRDGNETGGALRYVGATVKTEIVGPGETKTLRRRDRTTGRRTGDAVRATLAKPREKARFTFNETEPDTVPASNYYRLALQRGEIFPADAETAKAVDIKFTCVDDLRKAAKDKAAHEYKAAWGEAPAWAEPIKATATA